MRPKLTKTVFHFGVYCIWFYLCGWTDLGRPQGTQQHDPTVSYNPTPTSQLARDSANCFFLPAGVNVARSTKIKANSTCGDPLRSITSFSFLMLWEQIFSTFFNASAQTVITRSDLFHSIPCVLRKEQCSSTRQLYYGHIDWTCLVSYMRFNLS